MSRHFVRMIAGADERAAGDFEEAHLSGQPTQLVELFGGQVALDGEVSTGGLEVLAHREEGDADGAEVGEGVEDLAGRFAESEHEAALGLDGGGGTFGVGENP